MAYVLKVLLIISCSLVLFVQAKERSLHYKKNHHQTQRHKPFHQRSENATTNNSTEKSQLDFYYNSDRTLIGFLNVSAQTAAIFNYSSPSVLIVDGSDSKGVLIINSSQISIVNGSWTGSQQKFEDFFNSIQSLSQLGGSSLNQVDNSTLETIIKVSTSLAGIRSQNILVEISKIFVKLRIPLYGLIKGTGEFRFNGGLLGFVSVLKGISDLFPEDGGILGSATINGTQINLEDVLNSSNGLEALVKILRAIGNVDWSRVLRPSFNDPETFLKIVVELGGNDFDNGVDNAFKIIYALVTISRGHGSIDTLIQILLQVGRNGGLEFNVSDDIDEFLKLIEAQNNSGSFRALIDFLRDLNAHNLFLNGVNVSQVILLLQRGDFRGVINVTVTFLVHLNTIFNPVQSIPRFFGHLLSLFNSGEISPSEIAQFFNGTLIDPQALQNFNISHLIQNPQLLNNISQIPGVSQIYNEISECLARASNGSLNFRNLLNFNTTAISDVLRAVRPDNGANGLAGVFGGLFGGFFSPINSLLNGGGLQNLTSLINGFVAPFQQQHQNNSEISSTSHVESTTTNIISQVLGGQATKNKKRKHKLQKLHKAVKHHLHKKIHAHHKERHAVHHEKHYQNHDIQ